MDEESSSGFGDESPVLFKRQKVFQDDRVFLTLQELHKNLILHLKKTKCISKEELRSYSEQLAEMCPQNHKERWLRQKTTGLLNYILKKRADFTNCIVKGEIVIYEKSASAQNTFTGVPASPKTSILHDSYNLDIPVSMLSNNNFISMGSNSTQNLSNMDTDNSYNYSQDLFINTTQNLYQYAHENSIIFKKLTQNNVTSKNGNQHLSENDDKLFKIPYSVGLNVNLPLSLTPSFELKNVDESIEEFEMQVLPQVAENSVDNIFDDATIISEEIKEEYVQNLEETKKWVQEIIFNLKCLKFTEAHSANNVDCKNNSILLNDTAGSTGSTHVKTFHSEENFKIIREACFKYKKNLEQKKKEFFQDFMEFLKD